MRARNANAKAQRIEPLVTHRSFCRRVNHWHALTPFRGLENLTTSTTNVVKIPKAQGCKLINDGRRIEPPAIQGLPVSIVPIQFQCVRRTESGTDALEFPLPPHTLYAHLVRPCHALRCGQAFGL